MNKQEIFIALREVHYPNSKDSIVEEKLIRNIQIFENHIEIDIEVEEPVLHKKKKLEEYICSTLLKKGNKKKIKVNFHNRIQQNKKCNNDSLNVKNIIAIASGKGGVGKSTITTNVAITLNRMGFSVGILDADIYGPSIPLMFDVVDAKPFMKKVNNENRMIPIESYGIKMLSIGFFAKLNQAVVWRGPMATKALRQLIYNADWGSLDFLLIDLPPGTGDIHLSIVQQLPITGVVIVSTPQPISLADAKKGISMFQMKAINVPIIGLIQNMSYYESVEGDKQYIFGNNGVKYLADDLNIPFLGEIPIIQKVRESCDVGYPIALHSNHKATSSFFQITSEMVKSIVHRNTSLPPSEIVRITTMAGCSSQKI